MLAKGTGLSSISLVKLAGVMNKQGYTISPDALSNLISNSDFPVTVSGDTINLTDSNSIGSGDEEVDDIESMAIDAAQKEMR